jgi:hypothetical protein
MQVKLRRGGHPYKFIERIFHLDKGLIFRVGDELVEYKDISAVNMNGLWVKTDDIELGSPGHVSARCIDCVKWQAKEFSVSGFPIGDHALCAVNDEEEYFQNACTLFEPVTREIMYERATNNVHAENVLKAINQIFGKE